MPLVFIIESAVGLLSAFVLCQAICNIREYNVTLQMMCIQLLWYTFYELNCWIMMEAVVRRFLWSANVLLHTHTHTFIFLPFTYAPHDSQEECWHDEWWMVENNVRTPCGLCVKGKFKYMSRYEVVCMIFFRNVFPSRITYLFNPELQWTVLYIRYIRL